MDKRDPWLGLDGANLCKRLQSFIMLPSIAENAEPIRPAVTWNVSMVRSIFVGSVRAGKLRYAVFLILIE